MNGGYYLMVTIFIFLYAAVLFFFVYALYLLAANATADIIIKNKKSRE